MKKLNTPFQLPGCNRQNSNGITLPNFIEHPIETDTLNEIQLIGWDQVVNTMKLATTPRARTTRSKYDDNDMTTTTCLTRDDN